MEGARFGFEFRYFACFCLASESVLRVYDDFFFFFSKFVLISLSGGACRSCGSGEKVRSEGREAKRRKL